MHLANQANRLYHVHSERRTPVVMVPFFVLLAFKLLQVMNLQKLRF